MNEKIRSKILQYPKEKMFTKLRETTIQIVHLVHLMPI
jgi:hypothetical protein